MIERLEKLRDSLTSEAVIRAYLARGVNPYRGGEEECLVVVFSPESTNPEQADVATEIRRQRFAIDDFFSHLVIFDR